MTDRAIEELEKAGLFDKDSDYGGMIGEAVKELLLVFQKQGHSGFSANLVASLFKKLIDGDVLSELTDSTDEWMEVTEGLHQNNRCGHVFKDAQGAYTLDGKVFSDDGGVSWYTSRESHVYFPLPGYPPKTERVLRNPQRPGGEG